jgi:hypothetical protein
LLPHRDLLFDEIWSARPPTFAGVERKTYSELIEENGSMPVQVSYPGVYVQEIPSGVRTITGVATSITAFIGRALFGPDDVPVPVNSYGDFERIFGGLWTGSTLGYAVRDFFLNGGGQAIIVRLYNPETGANAKAAKSKMKVGDFRFEAADKVHGVPICVPGSMRPVPPMWRRGWGLPSRTYSI